MKSLNLILGSSLLGLSTANSNTDATANHLGRFRPGCQVLDDGATPLLTPRQFRRQQTTSFPTTLTVPVNFHIASTVAGASIINDSIIAAQFTILHDNFAAQNIHLVLNSTSRTIDDLAGRAFLGSDPPPGHPGAYNYSTQHPVEKLAYHKSTRRGGLDVLNMYFFYPYMPEATGYCQFPTLNRLDESDPEFWSDGCHVSALTMPGMPVEVANTDYNKGHIAVHEAGHWFGLNHTFAGGCGATGDFVADTPSQLTEVYECPVRKDTCPDQEGDDPIHNFMGYTSDICTNEFTPGQKERMFTQYLTYRRR